MTEASSIRIEEGRPYPQGATWTGLGVNFSLFSANATGVELCLFDDSGENEIGRRHAAGVYQREFITGSCQMRGPAPSTAIACMDRMSRRMATGSIPTSWCWTRMPRPSWARSPGRRNCLATSWARTTPRSTSATAPNSWSRRV